VLNQTAIYAVRAMGFLAKQPPGKMVLSSRIASEMGIPRNFLSKILNRLAQAGLIVTTRGRSGGVALARRASGILLNDVVQLFMQMNDYKQCFLKSSKCDGKCGLHLRWRIITEQFEQMLNDTTVDQIF